MSDKPDLKVIEGHKKTTPCPICSKASIRPHTPFCSARCAQIDLGKWLGGDYAIPAHEGEQDSNIEALLEQADKDPSLQ
jgi:endogenous inhibitor of DNA gyrase (YacG/DUF329 family)